jgi:hypothetical protein
MITTPRRLRSLLLVLALSVAGSPVHGGSILGPAAARDETIACIVGAPVQGHAAVDCALLSGSSVPEPTSLLLWGMGLIFFAHAVHVRRGPFRE